MKKHDIWSKNNGAVSLVAETVQADDISSLQNTVGELESALSDAKAQLLAARKAKLRQELAEIDAALSGEQQLHGKLARSDKPRTQRTMGMSECIKDILRPCERELAVSQMWKRSGLPEEKKSSFSSSCSALAKKGEIIRVRHGFYRRK